MEAAQDLAAMDVDGVAESGDAKDHQGSSMHGSLEEGGGGRVAADPETSTFPSSASEETKKTLSAATACGGGGGGDYEVTGSRDDCKDHGQLEVFNQRKRRSDSLASDSASLGGRDGEAASHVCRLCKREFSSGRALGGHMRAHGSLAMEDGNARTWNSENVAEKEQLTSWKPGRGTYLVNPLARLIHSGSDLDSCRDESSPSLASSRPRGINSCSRSEAGRLTKRGRVAAVELGSCQDRDDDQDMDEDHEEEATSVLLGSSSSEATNSNMQEEFDVTEGTSYMCQICEEEFETARDLNLHKKEHPQYILRMNPKRSQKFIDQDCDHLLVAAATAAPHQAKKAPVSSVMPQEKLPISCTECDKKFPSMKALFGHMRCHPERDWRGIQPPDRSTPQQAVAAAAAAGHTNHGSSRKKGRPPPVVLPTAHSESGSETDSKPAAGKGSDVDSDTESIEAAYINGSGRHNSGPPGWRTKKRTKRMRQTVRSLQAVTGAAATAAPEEPGPSTPTTETQVQKDIVVALMLLHPKTVAQVSPPKLEQRKGSSSSKDKDNRNVAEKFKAPNVVDNKSDRHDTHKHHHQRDHDDSKGKRHAEEAEDHHALVSDDQDIVEMETGEQGGGTRMIYQCATCKRIFKSHQALGGHRASHKKVKGCFARTSINDEGFGRQDQSTEDNKDIPDEDFPKAEQQLPHEPQEPSHSSEEDAEPCDYLAIAKGDNEEMLNAVRKTKGHECSICHRIFNSGQALGGHKRCHWSGTGTAGPNEATTVHNLNNSNAVMMVNGDQPGLEEFHPFQGLPVPGGQQSKGMQEGIIDLNMPAPECVEEIVDDQSASASASGMAPMNHHPSYLPFLTSTLDSAASIIHQPCSDPVEKDTEQHVKLWGESLDTKVDKSLEPIASGATDAVGCRTGDVEAMDQGTKCTEQPIKSWGENLDTKPVDKSVEPITTVTTDAVGFTTGDAEAMDHGMNHFSNTCDQGFTSLEHLSSHQKTHTTIMGPAPSLTA